MVEQRYQAVLAVIGGGETVTSVAARWGVSRKTVYEAGGLENLADRSVYVLSAHRGGIVVSRWKVMRSATADTTVGVVLPAA